LAILAGGATSVRGTGASANTSRCVANCLSRYFSSIIVAIGIDITSLTDAVCHAVVSLGTNATGIGGTSVNTKTVDNVTIRLSRYLTSI